MFLFFHLRENLSDIPYIHPSNRPISKGLVDSIGRPSSRNLQPFLHLVVYSSVRVVYTSRPLTPPFCCPPGFFLFIPSCHFYKLFFSRKSNLTLTFSALPYCIFYLFLPCIPTSDLRVRLFSHFFLSCTTICFLFILLHGTYIPFRICDCAFFPCPPHAYFPRNYFPFFRLCVR